MTRPIIRIYTASNEFIDREMNDYEYEQHLKDFAEYEVEQTKARTKAAQKQAIADRLGLTLDEIKLLLG
jgi:hypothetical protein